MMTFKKAVSLKLSVGLVGSSTGQRVSPVIVITYVTLGLVNLVCFRNFLRTMSCMLTKFSKLFTF